MIKKKPIGDGGVNNDLSPRQPVPSAYGGRRGLDVEVDGVRRQRREVRNLLPYKDQMMSYPASQRRVNDLYYQPDAWRARGLDEALQRLADKNQRWEEEEQQAGEHFS